MIWTPGSYHKGWLTYAPDAVAFMVALAPTARAGASRVRVGVTSASGEADGVEMRGAKGCAKVPGVAGLFWPEASPQRANIIPTAKSWRITHPPKTVAS